MTQTEARLLGVVGTAQFSVNCNLNDLSCVKSLPERCETLTFIMAAGNITLIVEPRGTLHLLDFSKLSEKLQPQCILGHHSNPSTGKPIRKLPKEVEIALDASSEELYTAFSAASGHSVHRLRITKGSDRSVVPNSSATIDSTGLRNSSVIHVKDLGTSIFRSHPPTTTTRT